MTSQTPALDDPIARFLRSHLSEIVDDVSEWATIPSVAGDPSRAIEVRRSAHWIAAKLREIGFATEEVTTGDAVAVLASMRADDEAPTVLVYSHHDVRHAKPEEWQVTDPFHPRLLDGRLYGRGTSDAKAQVIAHLWSVRAALAAADGADGPADTDTDTPPGLPLNLVLLIEGEEEIGSPNLRALLESRRDELAADLVVFSDTVQWPAGNPSAVTTMRGTITASLVVRATDADVHSGVVSGAAPNPAHALAKVLAALHDDDGRVAVPGFYDDVAALTPERARELADVPYDDARWLHDTGTRHIVGEPGFTTPERLWARPAVEVLTVLAGDPEGPARAVIPREARAQLSIRTVPDQSVHRVADLLRRFVAAELPATVEYDLDIDEVIAQEAYATPHGEALDMLERAMERGYGAPPAGRMGNAGGGPADVLSTVIDAPVVFIGTGLPQDRWHSADESVDVEALLTGAASLAHLWAEIGRSARRAAAPTDASRDDPA